MNYEDYTALTYDQVSSVFGYNKDTQEITKNGTPLDYSVEDEKPTIRISFDKKAYRIPATKVAWMLHYKKWPSKTVFQKDSDDYNFSKRNLVDTDKATINKYLTLRKNIYGHYGHLRPMHTSDDMLKTQVKVIENGRTVIHTFHDVDYANKWCLARKQEYKRELNKLMESFNYS